MLTSLPTREVAGVTTRNTRLRRRRMAGASTRQLSREFGITQTQVRRILDQTGGDPARDPRLEQATTAELERERARLLDRIAADRRRLRTIVDELEGRQTDAILGFG